MDFQLFDHLMHGDLKEKENSLFFLPSLNALSYCYLGEIKLPREKPVHFFFFFFFVGDKNIGIGKIIVPLFGKIKLA